MCNPDESTLQSADTLIQLALDEDLGKNGDITSKATINEDADATVRIVSRQPGIVCGAALIARVYAALCRRERAAPDCVRTEIVADDGETLSPGKLIASVTGPVRLLLSGERIVLNFLIHLSGIASLTAEFLDRTRGSDVAILDTRKTIPGYRLLHKFAVRCGGGTNHRIGLFDGMLIKDNHLAARGIQAVGSAVEAAREYLESNGLKLPIEVEVDTIAQLQDALGSHPDIVLLDNMPPSTLQQAVQIRNELSPTTRLEASGGITKESVACVAGTGVDRISIGGLTHSAAALDIGYDWPWNDAGC